MFLIIPKLGRGSGAVIPPLYIPLIDFPRSAFASTLKTRDTSFLRNISIYSGWALPRPFLDLQIFFTKN
jgi:hypothetical protein